MAIFYKQSMILELLLLNKTAMTSVFYTQSSKSWLQRNYWLISANTAVTASGGGNHFKKYFLRSWPKRDEARVALWDFSLIGNSHQKELSKKSFSETHDDSTSQWRVLILRLVLPPFWHHIQDGIKVEVHALVDGRVSDLPSLLKEITSLSELVHLDAQLQKRSHKRVPNSNVFLFIKFNMH